MKPPPSPSIDPLPADPPDCAASLASLQRRLDGDDFSETTEVLGHRAICSTCRDREEAARRLTEALAKMSIQSPAGLADRIAADLAAAPHRLRVRRFRFIAACLALAACVLIAVVAVVGGWQPTETARVTVVVRSAPPKQPDDLAARPTPLSESLNQAGMAAAALTRRTANENLNLKLPSLTLPDFAAEATAMDRLEPAVASIEQVRHGAVFGVAPITNSAKRAANMFWRELGPDLDGKP